MSLMEVPALSLDLINDALEYHSHAIVTGMDTCEDDALEHWNSMRYFWRLTRQVQPEVGRIFHRTRLAELVMYACRTHPLGNIELGGSGGGQEDEGPAAMVDWSPKDWDKLRVKLLELNQSVRREDANLVIRSPDDERPNIIRSPDEHQKVFLKRIMDRIVINKHLSRIRKEMEQWCQSTSMKQPHIDSSHLDAFVEDLEALRARDQKKFSFLRQFLARNSEPRKPKLAPMTDLEPVLKSNNCDLEIFAADILSLVMEWNNELFQNKQPALYRIGYGDLAREPMIDATYAVYETDDDGDISDDEYYRRGRSTRRRRRRTNSADFDDRKPPARTSPKEIAYMRSARAALRQSAPDPLKEACETASKAGTEKNDNPSRHNEHKQTEEDDRMTEQGNNSTTPEHNRHPRVDRTRPMSTQAAASSRNHDSDADHEDGSHSNQHGQRNDIEKQSRSSHRHHTAHSESTEFTSPTRKTQQERLKRKRGADFEGENDDDTEITEPESRASAKRTGESGGTPRPSSRKRSRHEDKYAKKKSARPIAFDDSEEETDDDGNDDLGRVRLSDLPRFASGTPTRRRIVVDKKEPTGPKRRKFWSKEEKLCIREGLRKFGNEKNLWRKIQEEYPEVLGGRTNVQIKDCARTMKNNGEIDF